MIRRQLMAFLTILAGVAASSPAASQVLASDSLAIVQAVVTTRTHWINADLKFNSCSVYENAGRPEDFGRLFSPVALDHVQDPCQVREIPYPLAIIERMDETGEDVIVIVIANGFEHVHREAFQVRRRDASSSEWFILEVRTSGFLRLHRPRRLPTPGHH